MHSLTLHNVALINSREIAPGVVLARDTRGYARLHNGVQFLGYVERWGRAGRARYICNLWALDRSFKFRRETYKTQRGAERALERLAPRCAA